MAHTASPWHYTTSGISERYDVYCSEQEGVICQNAREGDAILIHNAPKLLEVLEGLLQDIEDYQTINNLGGENNHWQVIARNVIKQARGIKP